MFNFRFNFRGISKLNCYEILLVIKYSCSIFLDYEVVIIIIKLIMCICILYM